MFRQLRLEQWVSGAEAWLPWDLWADRADPTRMVADRERVVLAFDGSASGDSTALIGCPVGPPGTHLFVAGLWENPGDPRWRVPREDVGNAVAAAFDRWDVAELAWDPWGWRSEIEHWANRHGESQVIEWNREPLANGPRHRQALPGRGDRYRDPRRRQTASNNWRMALPEADFLAVAGVGFEPT